MESNPRATSHLATVEKRMLAWRRRAAVQPERRHEHMAAQVGHGCLLAETVSNDGALGLGTILGR